MTDFTTTIQIAVDCADPHPLADWWAETLGWAVEHQDEAFIRRMIAEGHAEEAHTVVHNGRLAWRSATAITPTADLGRPDRQRILFQAVPEPKAEKNRVHLDFRLKPGSDRAAVRAELEERGATFLWEASQGPWTWCTMADPEGNEFCFG